MTLCELKPKWLFLLIPFICLMGCEPLTPRRPQELLLVPDGYIGWLQVFYEVKGAPPLRVKQGYRVQQFSRTGVIRTSSKFVHGWAKDKIFYTTPRGWKELGQSQAGGKGMVWNGGLYDDSTIPSDDTHPKGFWPPAQFYFIGIWKQYQKTKAPEYYTKQRELEFTRSGGRLANE